MKTEILLRCKFGFVLKTLICLEAILLFVWVGLNVSYTQHERKDRWKILPTETENISRSRTDILQDLKITSSRPRNLQTTSSFTYSNRMTSRERNLQNLSGHFNEVTNIFYLKVRNFPTFIQNENVAKYFVSLICVVSDPQDRQHDLPQHPQSRRSLAQPEDGALQPDVRNDIRRRREA